MCPAFPLGGCGASQVTWPSASCVPWSATAPGAPPPRPRSGDGACAFGQGEKPRRPGCGYFVAVLTRPACLRACARSGPHRFRRHRGGHQPPRRRVGCKARYRPAGLALWPGGIRPSVPLWRVRTGTLWRAQPEFHVFIAYARSSQPGIAWSQLPGSPHKYHSSVLGLRVCPRARRNSAQAPAAPMPSPPTTTSHRQGHVGLAFESVPSSAHFA